MSNEKHRFIIMKASRLPQIGDFVLGGYTGPACDDAGVSKSKIYDDLDEAFSDAELLSKTNPVGFDVWNVDTQSKVENGEKS